MWQISVAVLCCAAFMGMENESEAHRFLLTRDAPHLAINRFYCPLIK